MNFKSKRVLYESLPLWFKKVIGMVPFKFIAGRQYREVLARNRRFDTASYDEIRGYQEMILGKILDFATKQVPAYQAYRSSVIRYKPFDALKDFPLLDKDTIQHNFLQFIPNNIDKIPHYEISTGGTSGNQLKFYVENDSQSVDTAFAHRIWNRMGYNPKLRKATFRGVPFPNLKKDVYCQHNPIYNELQFSPFHMSEDNMEGYFEQFLKFKPTYLHGYPSAIDSFAEYILRNQLTDKLPKIKAAFLVSEGFTIDQRKRIEKAFETRVFSFYGHSERLVMAGECEYNETYHHFPDYGILEIISDDGSSCKKEGERGEIIGTGLLNRALPLIRYRSGDYATRCESYCECGRHWDRFTNVEGRWKQDMVIGHQGNSISIAALNMHGPLFEKVVRYQYLQDKTGQCSLKLMVAPSFTETDRLSIKNAYKKKTGSTLEWDVQIVNNIPLTDRGKLKLLVSTL